MAMLFLVRHGETPWNASRRLTGTTDISLNEKGRKQALFLARKLQQWPLSISYASSLKRTHQTLDIVKRNLGVQELQTIIVANFNERDCGSYTGLYKTSLSEETLTSLDEDWNYTPPQGESIAIVYERVISTFKKEIIPQLLLGKNVLIVSHYNPMRLLVAHLDNIPKEKSGYKGVGNGSLIAYSTENTGNMINFCKLTYIV